MKVNRGQFQQINKLYNKKKLKFLEGKEVVKSDKLNLSREAQEMKRIREVLAQTPDVRVEKVKQLKKSIQLGTYEVKGEEIAEKFVQSQLIDKIIG